MKYICSFYAKDEVAKSASPEKCSVLKEIWNRRYNWRTEDFYRLDAFSSWATDENTGFFWSRSNGRIYAECERIPEFEEWISKAKGYSNERKPTLKQKQSAKCYVYPYRNIGGTGDDFIALAVEVLADVTPADLIPIRIPEDLDAYEQQIKKAEDAARLQKMMDAQEKENKRRSQPMIITVGMWEDLMRRVEVVEDKYRY